MSIIYYNNYINTIFINWSMFIVIALYCAGEQMRVWWSTPLNSNTLRPIFGIFSRFYFLPYLYYVAFSIVFINYTWARVKSLHLILRKIIVKTTAKEIFHQRRKGKTHKSMRYRLLTSVKLQGYQLCSKISQIMPIVSK